VKLQDAFRAAGHRRDGGPPSYATCSSTCSSRKADSADSAARGASADCQALGDRLDVPAEGRSAFKPLPARPHLESGRRCAIH
jgi:hypothetical protein